MQGAIGVAVRIVALDAPPPAVAVAEGGDGIEPPTSASVVGAFRFRVGRLVSSFPFVTARVETFADAPREGEEEKTAALEVEVRERYRGMRDIG
jgi:Lon protease-like protein